MEARVGHGGDAHAGDDGQQREEDGQGHLVRVALRLRLGFRVRLGVRLRLRLRLGFGLG